MAKKRLNQILANEKGTKTRIYAEFTELHKSSQKPELFDGFHKTYRPLNEDDVNAKIPPQSKVVQMNYREVFSAVTEKLTELFDVAAARDWTNCEARGDIVVDGQKLLENVPATYLLFLDKQLSDLMKFISSVVELPPDVDWRIDGATGLSKSEPSETQRTEKKQRAIVLYDATEHHPAQTQLITEDQIVGYWSTIRQSGAMPRPLKQKYLDRCRKLAAAVKEALESANMTEAKDPKVGATVFSYLFGGE